jgi:hypothetical protein
VDLVKFLEKNKKLYIEIATVTLKLTSWRTMRPNNEKWKKMKNQECIGKRKKILSTLPFSPWAILATWLHVGAPQKIQEK